MSLAEAETELKTSGGSVLSVRADVSKRGDVELLARKTLDAFGKVHLLFNNAGVAAGGAPWEEWTEVIQLRTEKLLRMENPVSPAATVARLLKPRES